MHETKQEAWGRFLLLLGWDNTDVGAFFLERSSAYGVTTSYLQTFIWSRELIFGDGSLPLACQAGEPEVHVDRTLNVWGSGGAHKAYFTHLDEVIKSVFNAPLDEQPAGLVIWDVAMVHAVAPFGSHQPYATR